MIAASSIVHGTSTAVIAGNARAPSPLPPPPPPAIDENLRLRLEGLTVCYVTSPRPPARPLANPHVRPPIRLHVRLPSRCPCALQSVHFYTVGIV